MIAIEIVVVILIVLVIVTGIELSNLVTYTLHVAHPCIPHHTLATRGRLAHALSSYLQEY